MMSWLWVCRDMQRKLKDVDCVIEVHDARIPLSGRNTTFQVLVSC
jgi:hypothetical protein